MLILHNLVNKTEAEKPPSNLFDQASIIPIPKSETLPEWKKQSLINPDNKNPQQNISKSNPATCKNNCTP